MSDTQISQRYARALMTVANTSKKDPAAFLPVLEAIEELYSLPEAKSFLRNPVMPLTVKRELIDFAIQKAGGDTELKNFSEVIMAAGRVSIFPEIIASYKKLMRDLQGVEAGVVASVFPLASEDLAKLSAELSTALKRKVTLSQETDKSLLGGFKIRIGNYLVDHSLKTRIEALAFNANH